MSESNQAPQTETDDFADDLSDDIWATEASGPSVMARMLAELSGTFILVFMGLAALRFASGNSVVLTTALTFAAGMAIAYVLFSRISGAHVNPAVTVGMWIAGRFPGRDVLLYVLAQLVGGAAAALVIVGLVSWLPQTGQIATEMSRLTTGYGPLSPVELGLPGVLILEVLLVAIFVAVFLTVTSRRARSSFAAAPLTIGLAFGFLLILTIPFTMGSLNPARSTAVALFANTSALQQLWVFWFAALVGAAITGLLFRAFGPEEDLIIIEQIEIVETLDVIDD